MRPLPQELIDLIISYLDEEWQSLTACTTVSRAFLDTARSYLHFWVQIEESNVRAAAEGITPGVAYHVRELYLESFHDNCEWLSEGSLARLLPQLPRLRKIRLNRCSWPSLSSDLRAEAIRTLQRHSVRHVQIYGIENLPLSLFYTFGGVRHLELASISLASPGDLQSTLPHAGPRVELESLNLAVVDGELPTVNLSQQRKALIRVIDLYLSPSSMVDVTHLRHVSIDIELVKTVKRGLWRLLQACPTTLKCLKLHAAMHDEVEPFISELEPINLGILTALEALVIVVFVLANEIVKWLSHILSTLGPSSHIIEIKLVFVENLVLPVDDEVWAQLDEVFSRQGMVSLRRLQVEMTQASSSQQTTSPALIRAKLSSAVQRGILEIRRMEGTLNELFSVL